MSSIHSSGVPMVTEVGLDGKEVGRLELKPGTHCFLLCCHARFLMKTSDLVSDIVCVLLQTNLSSPPTVVWHFAAKLASW